MMTCVVHSYAIEETPCLHSRMNGVKGQYHLSLTGALTL